MSIRKLRNSDAEKLEQFLSDYAETSMFLRSNMKRAGLEYQNSDYHGDYFGAFDENGDVTGVLAHYWNGNIMMQALDKAILSRLIHAFREAVTRPVAGVLGADEQAKTVINELLLSDAAYATNRSEGLYALNLDKLSVPEKFDFSKVEMVDAGKVDRAILTQWIKAYEIEALGSEDNEALSEHVESRVNRTINGTDWRIFKDRTSNPYNIVTLRKKQGLTQEDLAGLTEMDRSYLSEIENGHKNLSVLSLFRIADALKVQPNDILKSTRK